LGEKHTHKQIKTTVEMKFALRNPQHTDQTPFPTEGNAEMKDVRLTTCILLQFSLILILSSSMSFLYTHAPIVTNQLAGVLLLYPGETGSRQGVTPPVLEDLDPRVPKSWGCAGRPRDLHLHVLRTKDYHSRL
jgi:hypothetical protein